MLYDDRPRPSIDIAERADTLVRRVWTTIECCKARQGKAYHDSVLKLHASQRQRLEQLGRMGAIWLWVRRCARWWCLSGGVIWYTLCCHVGLGNAGGELLVCGFQDVMMFRHIFRLFNYQCSSFSLNSWLCEWMITGTRQESGKFVDNEKKRWVTSTGQTVSWSYKMGNW